MEAQQKNRATATGIALMMVGLLFIFFNLTRDFGGISLSITPDFVGCILLYLAEKKLQQENPDFARLKVFTLVLAAAQFAQWVGSAAKIAFFANTVVGVAYSMVCALLVYVLLGNIQAIARSRHMDKFEKFFKALKYVYLVATVGSLLCLLLNQPQVYMVFIMASFLAVLLLYLQLNALRSAIDPKTK